MIAQSKIEKPVGLLAMSKPIDSRSAEPKSVQTSRKVEEVYRGYEISRGLDSSTRYVENKQFDEIDNARKYIDFLSKKETN